jgi:hypothetical protein
LRFVEKRYYSGFLLYETLGEGLSLPHSAGAFPASIESKTNKCCCGEHDGVTELSSKDKCSWYFSYSTGIRLQLRGQKFGQEIGKKSGRRQLFRGSL